VRRRLLACGLALAGLACVPSAARAVACTPDPGAPECAAWTGKVAWVDDGDTLDVDVAGDGTRRPVKVRVNGIQAMEQTVYAASRRAGECHAVAATLRLEQLVRRAKGRVRLTTQAVNAESYGRPERAVAVRLRGQWKDAGLILVREGLALWQPNGSDFAWNKAYNRATQLAAQRHLGLWDDDACGYGPSPGVPLALRVNWNAPGADTVNVDGEWVEIANDDPYTDVPLAGWWLRDSGLRRFTFPAGAVVPARGTVTLYVGKGTSNPAEFFWGLSRPAFDNVTADERNMGDGAYLFDPQGDLRAAQVYPCLVACPAQ
jgi:endonuclease YncB( thermonuclease family)